MTALPWRTSLATLAVWLLLSSLFLTATAESPRPLPASPPLCVSAEDCFRSAVAINERSGSLPQRDQALLLAEVGLDKAGIVHSTIGRRSFDTDKLQGNLAALVEALTKAKPATSKGVYLRKVAVSSTMGVGVRVDMQTIAA